MSKNKALMIAGAAMLTEGVVLAVWGRRYLELMENEGLMDLGKRVLRRLDIRSPRAFAAIGLAEAVFGLTMLRRAQASS
jgi:hypothetical protein